jgi:succinate-acetate transporter protein
MPSVSLSFSVFFSLLSVMFLFCGLAQFITSPVGENVTKIGSVVGSVAAFVAYYIGFRELLDCEKAVLSK